MSDLEICLTLGVFAAVILVIAFDKLDMAVATVTGATVLYALGILNTRDIQAAADTSGGTLALLFGGMVVARTLTGTGLFDRLGNGMLRATAGSGKRFLLLLIAVIAPVCALLPNATTVILLAPIIIRVAIALEVDFVGPIVITAIISNSAGLLTLVGDPATFLVGSSIGMSFMTYLKKVSLGGLLCLMALIPLMPVVLRDIWRFRITLPPAAPPRPLERPWFAVLAVATLLFMVALFVAGEYLARPILPPTAAIIGAALSLLLIYTSKIEPVDNVLHDIDWKTLVFMFAIFCLVQGVTRTGLLQSLSLKLQGWFGTDMTLVAVILLVGIGGLSSVVANTPVVAASLLMTKGYLVAAELVPETALSAGFSDWPVAVLPLFIAMMFGATLGGNATLIGASANVAGAGICAAHGKRVSFACFARYGLPITVCQLTIAMLYVLALMKLSR